MLHVETLMCFEDFTVLNRTVNVCSLLLGGAAELQY